MHTHKTPSKNEPAPTPQAAQHDKSIKSFVQYPSTKTGDTHTRIGLEIPRSRIRRTVEELIVAGKLHSKVSAMARPTQSQADLAHIPAYLPCLSQMVCANY